MNYYCRNFQIILVSADNLTDIRRFGKMKVYARVSLNGEKKTIKETTVDMVGDVNPRWNFPVDYMISESALKEQGELQVVVQLYCERTLGDKCLGEVRISVKGLFAFGLRAVNELSYTVAGTRYGRLNILYSFGNVCLFTEKRQSAWKRAVEVGKVVVGQGIWFLLTGDIDFASGE